jgi:hypothetical protein
VHSLVTFEKQTRGCSLASQIVNHTPSNEAVRCRVSLRKPPPQKLVAVFEPVCRKCWYGRTDGNSSKLRVICVGVGVLTYTIRVKVFLTTRQDFDPEPACAVNNVQTTCAVHKDIHKDAGFREKTAWCQNNDKVMMFFSSDVTAQQPVPPAKTAGATSKQSSMHVARE